MVADFDAETYDASTPFARIGGGSLGGKARGLARLMRLRFQVPPGFVVGRVSGPFCDDSCARETALWLRGSFRDVDYIEVQVGDESWSGWVDHFPGASGELDARRAL